MVNVVTFESSDSLDIVTFASYDQDIPSNNLLFCDYEVTMVYAIYMYEVIMRKGRASMETWKLV